MTTPLAPTPTRRPRVAILGGGYGGLYAALELWKAVRQDKIDVTLISRDNFFLVQPMLPEAVSGNIEAPHIVKSLRRLLPGIDFHHAEIDSVDPEEGVVHIRHHGATVERRIASCAARPGWSGPLVYATRAARCRSTDLDQPSRRLGDTSPGAPGRRPRGGPK